MSKEAALSFIVDYRDSLMAKVVDNISVGSLALVESRRRLEQARQNGADPAVQQQRWEELHRNIGRLAGCMLETEKLICLGDMINKLEGNKDEQNS